MAASVTLKVNVDRKVYDQFISELKATQSKPLELKVNVSGDLKDAISVLKEYAEVQKKATQQSIDAVNAEANLIKAHASLVNANTAVQRSEESSERAREKTKQKTLDLQIAEEKHKASLDRSAASIKKHNELMSALQRTFSLAQISVNIFNTAVSKMRSAFTEALGTIKEVDTTLSHYRQVTGATAAEADNLAESAYKVASAYGQSASDYVEAVATYARAGYAEQSEALAELSMKAQIAGQMNAEVADQFLLTVDAAYEYDGAVSKLGATLDKASYIDSHYATTIEKIAAGLGIVAPLASQVHVTEDELIASIGTITAATQRSGAETARALRSLFLSIIGDTKTEVEEGVTVTEEAVTDMSNLLRKYAPEAVAAAEATGQVIDPMKAIGALAAAMNGELEGVVLTEEELVSKLSSLGGKLRVSQLIALIKNFRTYQDMLKGMGDSVGDADKKVGIALESWEAKVNVLKNTFAEFVAKSLNSNTIKGIISAITNLIKLIGNLGNAIKMVAGIVATIKLIKTASDLNKVSKGLEGATENATLLAKAFTKIGGVEFAGLASKVAGVASMIIGAITLISTAITAYHNKRMEQLKEQIDKSTEQAEKSQTEAEEVATLYTKYAIAKEGYDGTKTSKEELAKVTEELTGKLEEEQGAIEGVTGALSTYTLAALQKAITDTKTAMVDMENAALEEVAHQRRWSMDTGAFTISNQYYYNKNNGMSDMDALVKAYTDRLKVAEDLKKRIIELEEGAMPTYTDELKDTRKTLTSITNDIGLYSEYLDPLIKKQEDVNRLQKEYIAIENGLIDGDLAEKAKELAEAEGDLADAQDKVNESAEEAKTSIEKLKEAMKVDKADDFKTVAEAYQKAVEDIQKGFKNSNNVNALAKMLFSEEQINAMRLKGIDVADAIMSDFYQEMFMYEGEFTGGEDSGALGLWYLYDHFADEAGNIVDANGNVVASFQEVDGVLSAQVKDFKALSDALGSKGVVIGVEALEILFKALENYGDTTKTRADDLKEIAEAVGALKANGTIDLEILAENLDLTEEEVANLKDEIEDFNGKTFRAKIDADTSAAMRKMGDAYGLATRLQGTYSVKVELTDNASAKLAALQGQLSTAISKTYNLNARVNVKQTMAEGGTAKGGLTLVNEKGAEIIQEGDTARIAGNGKPTLTWLQQGATVYNASETRAMLGGYNPEALFDRVNAYSNGVTGVRRWTGTQTANTSTNTSVTSNNSSTSNTRNSSNTANTSATTTTDTTDAELERLENIVKLRKTELELAKATGETTSQLVQRHKAIANALKEQIEYLKKTGGDQAEINTLTAEYLSKEEDIISLQQGDLEDIVSLRKSELSLLQAQGASADKQAEKYRQIQKALLDVINFLKQTNGSQEEINKLTTEYLNINDSIAKLYETEQKEQSEKYDDLVALRKSEYDLLEAQGASYTQLIAKNKQIQAALQAQINYLKKTGAEQEKINKLTAEMLSLNASNNKLSLENYENIVTLRQSEYNLLEAQGQKTSVLVSKYKEIQKALQNQLAYMKSIGADQSEINDLSVQILEINTRIEKLYEEERQEKLATLEANVALKESELALLEAQGKSTKEQILKQREIQRALLKQIEYMKSIGAEQKEINALMTQYYNISSDIEGLQKGLLDDLEKAINNEISDINEKRDAELDKIKEQIDALKKQKEIEDKQLDLEEKQLAVEEARAKLRNAQAERTVRYYNAATGQWEWKANAKNVKSAEDALQKALDSLREYQDKKSYEGMIAALEAEQDAVTKRYEALTNKWEAVLDKLEEPVITIAQALQNIANNGTVSMRNDIKELNAVLKPLGYSIGTSKLYDNGGVLNGMGGIKATAYDEMVIPPEITRKMLSPLATNAFSARMNELNYLYGASAYRNLAGVNTTSIGNQYNGDRYTFGNITLSKDQAKSMTVYDLVQQSRNLRAYSSAI